jgi:hypothetical protein
MEYKVIQHQSLQDLIFAVNDAINLGWKPQGGICASRSFTGGEYYLQALVKIDKPLSL